jgi:hypothetical protein
MQKTIFYLRSTTWAWNAPRYMSFELIKVAFAICRCFHFRFQSQDIQFPGEKSFDWSLATQYWMNSIQCFNKFNFSVWYKLQITHAVNFSMPLPTMNEFVLYFSQLNIFQQMPIILLIHSVSSIENSIFVEIIQLKINSFPEF